MSRRDVGTTRLDLGSALTASARCLPRLWMGAGGVLAACGLIWLARSMMDSAEAVRIGLNGVGVLTTLAAVGALARLSITEDAADARASGLGPGGFQLGLPEARLLGAGLLCLIFLAMIVIVLALVVLAIFGTAELNVAAIQARDWSAVGSPWKLGLLGLLAAVAIAVPLMLASRLMLFVPATIGRRQMVSLNAMSLSKGSVGGLATGLVVTALPAILFLALGGSGLFAGAVAYVATAMIFVGLQLPLTLGFLGGVYRQLETWTPSETKT